MASIPPYSAILPTILCQQPSVILHWLQTERATGNLPVEIVLDVLIELVSRQINPTTPAIDYSKELAIYREAVEAMRILMPLNISAGLKDTKRYQSVEKLRAWRALDAVDKLEGK